MGDDGDRISVEGQSFWRSRSRQGTNELNNASFSEVGPHDASWRTLPAGEREGGDIVTSESRAVHWFLSNVLENMRKAARRKDVRPVPKPSSSDSSSSKRFIPCPQCQGEAWPGCETCEGAGYIRSPQRR